MNETFNKYWYEFNERFIRLQMKSRMTREDLHNLKHMRKEREQLIIYMEFNGYKIDDNGKIKEKV